MITKATHKKKSSHQENPKNQGSDNMKQGWEIKKLGEVCETGAGGTPLKTHKDYYEGGTIPWLLSGEVSQGEIFESKNFITEKGLKNSSAKLFPPNTVLVAMYGATAGQVGILRFEACTNQAVCGILPNDKTIPEYLFYCFLSKKEELVAQAVGGAQPNISQIKIRNTQIPLPPLPEQQRIVSILDECFAAIDKALANAEQNLKNAKELFESYLQGVFENKGYGWEECNLEDNIKLIDYRGRTPEKTESGVRLITAKNVKLGFLQLEPQEFIAEDNYESWMTRGIPDVGDVIFTTEAPLANVAQIETDEKLAFAQRIIVMQPNRKKLNPTFLKYMLLSGPIRKRILEKGTGATVVGIKSSLLKKIQINFPKSVSDQQTIVHQLDALRVETQKLEAVYQKKMADLGELKKSILQKAFAGELKTGKSRRDEIIIEDGNI
jgi:type I restriction enzyme S subunit